MQRMELEAKLREPGKATAKKLRITGMVPAVLYGAGEKPNHLSVNEREIEKLERRGGGFNFLLDLKLSGGETVLAMVKEFQSDVITRKLTHLDFRRIDINQKLDVEVPLLLLGTPEGVKEGGVVDQLKRKIHIRALPTKIPEHLEVDISSLKIGDSIHADEITLPEGVEFPHVVNYTVVAVVPPTKIEATVAPVTPVEGEAGAVAAEGEASKTEGAAPAAADKGAADKKPAEKKGADATKGSDKKE